MNINIYPNPARHQITMASIGIEDSEYAITNAMGQRVYANASVQSGKIVIETSNLPRGLYLITISNKGNTVTRKIILE